MPEHAPQLTDSAGKVSAAVFPRKTEPAAVTCGEYGCSGFPGCHKAVSVADILPGGTGIHGFHPASEIADRLKSPYIFQRHTTQKRRTHAHGIQPCLRKAQQRAGGGNVAHAHADPVFFQKGAGVQKQRQLLLRERRSFPGRVRKMGKNALNTNPAQLPGSGQEQVLPHRGKTVTAEPRIHAQMDPWGEPDGGCHGIDAAHILQTGRSQNHILQNGRADLPLVRQRCHQKNLGVNARAAQGKRLIQRRHRQHVHTAADQRAGIGHKLQAITVSFDDADHPRAARLFKHNLRIMSDERRIHNEFRHPIHLPSFLSG